MDGSVVFARWCQCAPHLIHASLTHPSPNHKWHLNRFNCFCTHSRELLYFITGRLLSPLKLPLPMRRSEPPSKTFACVHPNPQLKQHLDRFSRFFTAHGRASLHFTNYNGPIIFPVQIARPYGGSGPPANTWFLWLIRAQNPNCISIGSVVFSQLTADCLYTLQWDAPPPAKNKLTLHMARSGPLSNTWFLGPTWVLHWNGISISWAVFAELTTVTDQQTTLFTTWSVYMADGAVQPWGTPAHQKWHCLSLWTLLLSAWTVYDKAWIFRTDSTLAMQRVWYVALGELKLTPVERASQRNMMDNSKNCCSHIKTRSSNSITQIHSSTPLSPTRPANC